MVKKFDFSGLTCCRMRMRDGRRPRSAAALQPSSLIRLISQVSVPRPPSSPSKRSAVRALLLGGRGVAFLGQLVQRHDGRAGGAPAACAGPPPGRPPPPGARASRAAPRASDDRFSSVPISPPQASSCRTSCPGAISARFWAFFSAPAGHGLRPPRLALVDAVDQHLLQDGQQRVGQRVDAPGPPAGTARSR